MVKYVKPKMLAKAGDWESLIMTVLHIQVCILYSTCTIISEHAFLCVVAKQT